MRRSILKALLPRRGEQKEERDIPTSRDDYWRTGPNEISYWAGTPAFRSGILRCNDGETTAAPSHQDISAVRFTYDRQLIADKGEIRLLHLLPGRDGDIVRCELRDVSLKANPTFLALSYCWEELPGFRTIIVNGGHMEVGANLVSALEHLRSTRHTLVLWADAVCINQLDDKTNREECAGWSNV